MENRKEGNWMSVPTFGDWDTKNGPMPDYSMDFTKIREMRKQNKKEISRASLGNEEELTSNPTQGGGAHRGNDGNLHHSHVDSRGSDEMDHRRPLHHVGDHSPTSGDLGFLTSDIWEARRQFPYGTNSSNGSELDYKKPWAPFFRRVGKRY